jgi:hypothetical protein
MEMSQENSLDNDLKQTKMPFCFLQKMENSRIEQVLPGRLMLVGGGKEVEKECRRVNMV